MRFDRSRPHFSTESCSRSATTARSPCCAKSQEAFQEQDRSCEFDFANPKTFAFLCAAERHRSAALGSDAMKTRRLGWSQFKASRLPAARAQLERRWELLIVDEEAEGSGRGHR